jgi:hypothetical protein
MAIRYRAVDERNLCSRALAEAKDAPRHLKIYHPWWLFGIFDADVPDLRYLSELFIMLSNWIKGVPTRCRYCRKEAE